VQFAGECFHLVSTAGSGSSPNRESNALHLITRNRLSPRRRATENIISEDKGGREEGRECRACRGLIGSAFSSGHGCASLRIIPSYPSWGRAPLESSTSRLAPREAKARRKREEGIKIPHEGGAINYLEITQRSSGLSRDGGLAFSWRGRFANFQERVVAGDGPEGHE